MYQKLVQEFLFPGTWTSARILRKLEYDLEEGLQFFLHETGDWLVRY